MFDSSVQVLQNYLALHDVFQKGSSIRDHTPSIVLRRAVLIHGGGFDAVTDPERVKERHAITDLIEHFKESTGDAEFRAVDGDGRTLLHCACTIDEYKAAENCPDSLVVRSLLDACSSSEVVNTRDASGRTPLATLVCTANGNEGNDVSYDGEGELMRAVELLLPLTSDKTCDSRCLMTRVTSDDGDGDGDDYDYEGPKTLSDVAFHLGFPRLLLLLLRAGVPYTEGGLESALLRQGTCEIDAVVDALLDFVTTDQEEDNYVYSKSKLCLDLCKAVLRVYVVLGSTQCGSNLDVGATASDMLVSRLELSDDATREFLRANMATPEKRRELVMAITHDCYDS
jgi:hypothetical protein